MSLKIILKFENPLKLGGLKAVYLVKAVTETVTIGTAKIKANNTMHGKMNNVIQSLRFLTITPNLHPQKYRGRIWTCSETEVSEQQ
jgi:hypothetical protein